MFLTKGRGHGKGRREPPLLPQTSYLSRFYDQHRQKKERGGERGRERGKGGGGTSEGAGGGGVKGGDILIKTYNLISLISTTGNKFELRTIIFNKIYRF